MSLNTNQISAEERKKNREKFMIKDKQNETIYRHYGDLNGADFKLRKNIKCEIYILDWSKGMYIDDCEDCKIVVGPIDGSVFIRGSKNCEFSIIARQVRFRNCENLKVFTYCPSDPAVESSFNIYFAPFNAFFPHLKELFVKGEFKKEEKNHIDTPYDFTPGEELGGGAQHYLKLPEEEFYIKVVNDGNSPVEEMYEGYSQEEPWIQNKSSELPNFEQGDNNRENDDFNFVSENRNGNENKVDNNQPSIQPTLNDFIIPSNNQKEEKLYNDNNNFMNMDDFLSSNFTNLSAQNKQNNAVDFNSINNKNNDNNNFMDFFGDNNNNNNNNNSSKPQTNLDLNNDFNMFNVDNTQNNNNAFNNSNNFFNNNMPNNISKEASEEMKRQELRDKERQMRQERIKQKMEKEAKMRMEIMRKASEYINQFYEERKKRIALNHEKLMQGGGKQNNNSSGGSPWGMVESSFTGSTSNADRMKEVILNKNKDLNK